MFIGTQVGEAYSRHTCSAVPEVVVAMRATAGPSNGFSPASIKQGPPATSRVSDRPESPGDVFSPSCLSAEPRGLSRAYICIQSRTAQIRAAILCSSTTVCALMAHPVPVSSKRVFHVDRRTGCPLDDTMAVSEHSPSHEPASPSKERRPRTGVPQSSKCGS
jgi:hypothetical protein